MLTFETKCEVTEVGLDTIEFNGYKYKVSKAKIAKIEDFYIFTRLKKAVEVGDCLNVSVCCLTNYITGDAKTLALRIEEFEVVPKEEFEPLEKFHVRVNGCVLRTNKSVVRYVGPSRIPLLKATIRVYNENRKVFTVLLEGYCGSVKVLDKIVNDSYVDLDATLRRQCENKNSYQLNVEDFKYIKKGEN